MIELTAALSPLLLVSVVVPLPTPELFATGQWLHVWLPALGLLGMGIRDVFGAGADETDADDEAEDDFLGDGFGSTMQADGGDPDDGFPDGLGDDGLGGDDGDGFDEIEPRMDDLETELADLAATVSSVHSDHAGLEESLEGIEDNVRKLLEVYEVVTQDMNPFATEDPELSAGASAFGLFEDDDLDESAEDDETETLFEDAEADEGLTFDDLKSEFEFVGDRADLDGADERSSEEPDQGDVESAETPTAVAADAKPYLATLPSGFGAELVVMEWLDYLVTESSVVSAIRAIRYYETVEWLSAEVASHLQSVLAGMSPPRELAATDGGQPIELSVDHHAESLEYVSQLRALDGEAGPLRESPRHRVGERGGRQEGHGVQR